MRRTCGAESEPCRNKMLLAGRVINDFSIIHRERAAFAAHCNYILDINSLSAAQVHSDAAAALFHSLRRMPGRKRRQTTQSEAKCREQSRQYLMRNPLSSYAIVAASGVG